MQVTNDDEPRGSTRRAKRTRARAQPLGSVSDLPTRDEDFRFRVVSHSLTARDTGARSCCSGGIFASKSSPNKNGTHCTRPSGLFRGWSRSYQALDVSC